MKRDVNYYMSLPYKVEIQKDQDGSYIGRIVEFETCMSEADTIPELMEELEDAKKCWIEAALESGYPIPELNEKEYSGQFNLRIPKSLHRSLVMAAQKENVSLNQYILYMLSKKQSGKRRVQL